jgi:predicted nucleic acid-binding protein
VGAGGAVTDRPTPTLADRIAPGASLLIDSSVVLAYLAGDESTSPQATELFDSLVATGRNPAALSMVTVGEILVRPLRRGPAAVAVAEGFLRHFADMRLIDVSYGIAREAARLRALTDLPMPDALIVSSALTIDADVLVTNDRTWRPRLVDVEPRLNILEVGTEER